MLDNRYRVDKSDVTERFLCQGVHVVHSNLYKISRRYQFPEVFKGVKSDQSATFHKSDPATEFFRLIHVMCGENDRRILLIEHHDLLPYFPAGLWIETNGGFI